MRNEKILFALDAVEDAFLENVLDILERDQEKYAKHLRLLRILPIAAIIAGVLGITVYAMSGFSNLFQGLAAKYRQWPDSELGQLYSQAANAVPQAEPTATPITSSDGSAILIGQTYYDGKTFLISYRIDEAARKAELDFGPGSDHFDELHEEQSCHPEKVKRDREWYQQNYPEEYEEYVRTSQENGLKAYQEICRNFLEEGLISQAEYDRLIQKMDEGEDEYRKYHSNLVQLGNLRTKISQEEFEAVCSRLWETGTAGVVFREIFISDGMYLENGEWLRPDENGIMWSQERTEDGICIFGPPLVPEPYRDQDHFTITIQVKSLDCYWFFDLSRGAWWYHEAAGIEPVTVTIPRSE